MKKLLTVLLLVLSHFMATGQTYNTFDANLIKAKLHCRNYQFSPPNDSIKGYEFPAGSGLGTVYATNLWVYGLDSATNVLKGFGDKYGNGNDTWPGPLTTNGLYSTTTPVSNQYDSVWKITQTEIIDFVNAFNNGSVTSMTYPVPPAILNWPAQGPAGYSQSLSPYHDENNDGVYDPYDGDYPIIQGTEMLRWIMNDNLGTHTAMGAPAMGVEIQASFFGCSSPDEDDPINRTTFLEFKIVNRSPNIYKDVYIGLNTDGDIGGSLDDYIRSNVELNSVQFYNADGFDDDYAGNTGYHGNPPVQSITLVDVDGYSIPNLMSGMMYYNNTMNVIGDPQTASEQYRYLQNYWKDGSPLTFGGTGYSPANPLICRYMFPGESDPANYGTYGVPAPFTWTEENADSLGAANPAGDRRAILSSGPLLFLPGKTITVVYAFITTQDSTLTSDSLISTNNDEIAYITQQYLANQLPCQYEYIGVENQQQVKLSVFPNPANEFVQVKSEVEIESIEVIDINGSVLKVVKNQGTILTHDLDAGMYLLKIYPKDHIQPIVKKLVVNR